MKNLAPIALFTYNRLDFIKILVDSLKKNTLSKKSIIYIFSDSWKDLEDKKNVLEVRNFIKNVSGFKKIIIISRKKNYGLAKNIISGVNFVLKKNKKIIVLEDDLELSKYFLNYLNDGLNIYEKEKKLLQYMDGLSQHFRKVIYQIIFLFAVQIVGGGVHGRELGKKLI